MYKCGACKKWFEKAVLKRNEEKSYKTGKTLMVEKEVCPFCGARVYPTGGFGAALVALWMSIKESFKKGR